MRRTVEVKAHLSIERVKERLYRSKNARHASYWQIILTASSQPGKPAADYCAYLGISDTKFYRIVSLYNEKGASFWETVRWGGRREQRCALSVEQEAQLLKNWAPIALAGKLLVAKQLREAVEQKVEHSVSDDYLWDMLRRHGWTKKAPRPEHPQADEVTRQRDTFKKKPRHALPPPPGKSR